DSVYVDPHTGIIYGKPKGADFFRGVRQVHRWLAAGAIGKQVVGASTALLVLLCLSGLYLRWPRRRALDWRTWLSFQWSRRGRSFLWHLHAVAGTWVLLAYLLMGLTGLYWSYEWYRNGLYALAGTSRPAPAVNNRSQANEKGSHSGDVNVAPAWATFQREAPSFTSVTLRLPQRSQLPLQVSYLDDDSPHERAFNRMAVDVTTGSLLRHERYAEKTAGARLLSSIFALHSGSFFGLPGVIALMLASLMMPLFTITGWMMYLGRRRRAPRFS